MLILEPGSEQDQKDLGAKLARVCPPGFVIFLEGDLGTGKTTLVRGFLRGLGYTGSVRSPTYTLIEPYRVADRTCYHLDLYRIADPEELEFLGLRDLLGGPATLIVEWPERGAAALPAPDLHLHLEHIPAGRRIVFTTHTADGREVLAKIDSSSAS